MIMKISQKIRPPPGQTLGESVPSRSTFVLVSFKNRATVISKQTEVPVSSVLCLSSVRELPVQVRELYAQGFVLVSVHPFVHPCGPHHARIQRQLHRAVLVRETPSCHEKRWWKHRLETDVCAAGHQAADPEVIQNYVKRIQDVAEQGVMFVGFLQQPGGAPCFTTNWDPDELSSLHSSPSPIHRHPLSSKSSPTDPSEPSGNDSEPGGVPFDSPKLNHESGEHARRDRKASLSSEADLPTRPSEVNPKGSDEAIEAANHRDQVCESQNLNAQEERGPSELGLSSEKHFKGPSRPDHKESDLTWNNNHICVKNSHTGKDDFSAQARLQLFALYNSTGEVNTSLRFYSLRVPLRVQKEAGLVTDVDGDWLDHMTQHFTNGAQLIDGFFHLRDDHDNEVSSVDSVFIFHNSTEESTGASYDAIVVEQWTVINGVVVKADYVPLLQSLAPYGWRLMCVLPTPIVKTNSDGSLSTKQILFLQRPVLQRKRKDFKMLNLRGRHKTKKHSCGEMLEEGEDRSLVSETEMGKLRRIKEDHVEGRKNWAGGRTTEGWREEAEEEKDLSFLSGSLASSVEGEEEEETDIDSVLTSKREKSVRWTEVCQRGSKEEVKPDERIKHQLFSGVC
ncbi:raftlin isoform X2 [Syngnathus typhle]|uniref:raftlin isoform X2 n=1 Tax=Syngnathus typhle TaxID=161592 RepID=UPI002A6B8919|nr:raftlin isoform X2 [Syngnathus typhle]